MRISFLLSAIVASVAVGSLVVRAEGPANTAVVTDPATPEVDVLQGMQPVMVPLKDRESPGDDEWNALQVETQRSLISSLADFRSRTISFMDTKYFTPNRAEGTLAAYGKMDSKNRFDRYGHIVGVEFDVPKNSWKERYALNAAALVKLTGKGMFEQFAGVELATAVNDRRQIEVTFLGTMVPKDEAVRRLNADIDALEYLGTLHQKRAKYEQRVKLLAGPEPPKPKIVLGNVMVLDGKSAKFFDGDVDVKVENAIEGFGGSLKLSKQSGEETTYLTPVVRCYRTYSIEFRTDNDGRLKRVTRSAPDGTEHEVPVVFDLTPDL